MNDPGSPQKAWLHEMKREDEESQSSSSRIDGDGRRKNEQRKSRVGFVGSSPRDLGEVETKETVEKWVLERG